MQLASNAMQTSFHIVFGAGANIQWHQTNQYTKHTGIMHCIVTILAFGNQNFRPFSPHLPLVLTVLLKIVTMKVTSKRFGKKLHKDSCFLGVVVHCMGAEWFSKGLGGTLVLLVSCCRPSS